ncbi:MAG: hypothetical protein AB1781_07545 [Pseudomonadota bacterium]
MSSSSFLDKPQTPLVIDASVVINLNATGRAHEIIRAFPNPFLVTENAAAELANGARNGHTDSEALQDLVRQRVLQTVALDPTDLVVYETLIEGHAAQTLDDGEAATIAFAVGANAMTILDERKARNICATRFQGLTVFSTADLLTHDLLQKVLGKSGQIDAIVAALQGARMRVPPDRIDKVVNLIGKDAAANCHSLPSAARFIASK